MNALMTLFLVTLFSLILVLFGCFLIIVGIYTYVIGNIKGALFLPSNRQQIKTMIELAQIKEGTRVVDLGSGNGAVIFEAVRHGAIATGVEFNPFLVYYSRWRAKQKKLSSRITIIKGNIMDYPLHDVDVVFLYLLPKFVAKISDKLRLELPRGARIISNSFPLPGWPIVEQKNGIFLYQQK